MNSPTADKLELEFRGRVAVVSGSRGPLGRRIADALLTRGASVVGADISPVDSGYVHDRLHQVQIDLTHDGAAELTVAGALEKFGSLDYVVNNAALTGTSGVTGYAVPLDLQRVEAWRAALEVNLTAAFVLSQAARDHLRVSGHGAIVNIGSVYGGVAPDPGLYEGTTMGNPAAYGVSKAGLAQMTRYLAVMLAPEVRVNMVSPGGIERGQDPKFVERYLAKVPLQRMATEDDIVSTVLFMLGNGAAYVTGQNLVVDGGLTCW